MAHRQGDARDAPRAGRRPGQRNAGRSAAPGLPRDLEVIQYWESHEKLLAYATAQDHKHRPAWTEFNRRVRAGHGKVGIWHETYLVPAGAYETIYVNMPPHGLAAATGTAPISRRGNTAAERLGLRPSS